ncbi:MAG TPA: hypothetical protein VHG28_18940, partial [Longimicrobiaceae bacterium]|nr:hypothetical protein [Longimicrobiaceae bacterium]
MIRTGNRRPGVVVVLAALMTLLGSVGSGMASAQATTVTTQVRIPLNHTVVVDGESYQVSGSLHALFHVTRDAAGGRHLKAHVNGQGVSAVGGGTTYRVNTAANFTANLGAAKEAASNFTAVVNFGLIGQGRTPNLRLHVNLHGTVNANGEVTATVAHVRITR